MAITNLDILQGLAQLPGLTGEGSLIAMAWLLEHYQEFDWVDFNVRVGPGTPPAPGSPDYIFRYALATSTQRIDMALGAGEDVTLVEVKIRVGGAAAGQLLLYRKLWLQAHPETKRVFLIAIGQSIQPGALELFQEHNIHVELYPNAAAPGVKQT